MQQRKCLRRFDRPFISYVGHVLRERESGTDRRCNQRTLYVATFDLRTPRRRFCPYRCRERRSASVEEGSWGEPRGLARFALPECRGRVFGRDTKVRAPRIPWLRLPGWANICVSRRRDFAAKSRAASLKSRGTKSAHSRSDKYIKLWWIKILLNIVVVSQKYLLFN